MTVGGTTIILRLLSPDGYRVDQRGTMKGHLPVSMSDPFRLGEGSAGGIRGRSEQ